MNRRESPPRSQLDVDMANNLAITKGNYMNFFDSIEHGTDRALDSLFNVSRHNLDRDEAKYQARLEEQLHALYDDSEALFEWHINSDKAEATFKAMFTAYRNGDYKSVELFARSLCADVEEKLEDYAEGVA
jgi:hypothetical protein